MQPKINPWCSRPYPTHHSLRAKNATDDDDDGDDDDDHDDDDDDDDDDDNDFYEQGDPVQITNALTKYQAAFRHTHPWQRGSSTRMTMTMMMMMMMMSKAIQFENKT